MRTKNIFLALALMVAAMLLSAPVASAQDLTPKVNPKSGLYGYWGTKNNGDEAFIIKPKFDKAERFVNGHAFVSVNGAWYIIGIDGKALSSTTYSEAFALGYDHYHVCQDGKYGVVDLRSLTEILPIKYDAIGNFDGKYKLKINGKVGLADRSGAEILPIMYDAISAFDDKYKLTIDGKQGLADKSCAEILPIKYDKIDTYDGKYKLTIDGKHGLADKSGTEILSIKYDKISVLDTNAYKVAIGDKYGIVDKTNKVIVEPLYKAIEWVVGGLYALFSDKWIFVDSSGKVVDISDRVMHYTTNNGQKIAKHSADQNLFCDGEGVLVFTNVIEPEQWINFLVGFANVNRINGKDVIRDGSFIFVGDKLVWVDKDALSISIPATVKSIAPSAFKDCKNIRNVNVADLNVWLRSGVDMSSCGSWQLYHNGKLATNVTIPNGVTEIAPGQFCDNSSLTSITIPASVKEIGRLAFYGCSSLTNVTISNGVTKIGEKAFNNCTSLYSVTIGNSVTWIGNYAFKGCSSLGSIIIPASVTEIGVSAFEDCSSLTNVTISNGVTKIGDAAFKYCSSLGSITIPASVKEIGESAFEGCSSLTSVTIGNSVTSIGEKAFNNCTSLYSVTIGNSVTWIGNYAFKGCSSLSSITIPASVKEIGESAFEGCSSLTNVTISNGVTKIGEKAFNNCTSLYSVTIGNSVTSIGNEAFKGCFSLSSITIPASVTYIGKDAFRRDEDWGTFYIYMKSATPPALGGRFVNWYTEYEYDSLGSRYGRITFSVDVIIYVPENALFNYRTADVWKEMADRIMPMD